MCLYAEFLEGEKFIICPPYLVSTRAMDSMDLGIEMFEENVTVLHIESLHSH